MELVLVPVPANSQLKLEDVFAPIVPQDLSDNIEELNYVNGIIEKATGGTAPLQGAENKSTVTLGEVKIDLQNAKKRAQGMSKFYTQVWKERALIFLKLVEAASDKLDAVKIYKKGLNSNDVYTREIAPKDWMTKSGYGVKIWSQEERDALDTDTLNKLNAVKANMPDNPKLNEIYDRKLLEFAGLKPDEITDVMKVEQEKAQAVADGKAQGNKPPTETMQLPYQYVPEDIKRQYEAAFGFKPSTMAPGAPMDQNGQPGQPPMPGQTPGQPGQPTAPVQTPPVPMQTQPKPVASA